MEDTMGAPPRQYLYQVMLFCELEAYCRRCMRKERLDVEDIKRRFASSTPIDELGYAFPCPRCGRRPRYVRIV
jgi:hypothetical protein